MSGQGRPESVLSFLLFALFCPQNGAAAEKSPRRRRYSLYFLRLIPSASEATVDTDPAARASRNVP